MNYLCLIVVVACLAGADMSFQGEYAASVLGLGGEARDEPAPSPRPERAPYAPDAPAPPPPPAPPAPPPVDKCAGVSTPHQTYTVHRCLETTVVNGFGLPTSLPGICTFSNKLKRQMTLMLIYLRHFDCVDIFVAERYKGA